MHKLFVVKGLKGGAPNLRDVLRQYSPEGTEENHQNTSARRFSTCANLSNKTSQIRPNCAP
jgi:hypothetical protein